MYTWCGHLPETRLFLSLFLDFYSQMAIIEDLDDKSPTSPIVSAESDQALPTPVPTEQVPATNDQKNQEQDQQDSPVPSSRRTPADDDDAMYFYDAAESVEDLVAKANEFKTQGNQHFGRAEYRQALRCYQDANAVYPAPVSSASDDNEEGNEDETKDDAVKVAAAPKNDSMDQRSVFAANMAACYLKMDQPKDAKRQCDIALEHAPMYSKARLRRAQANERIATSAALSDALKDYQWLLDQHQKNTLILDASTLRTCQYATRTLPPRIDTLMEQEKAEMIGKLKDLGNTVLGKFGLSTDNFQFQKDPSTGNYSMNFVNNP
ncbi:hypothetical protein BC940DRAFT_294442 [Gongronella butleri]|nr:hypothetical protein BC940DRAFT_294442 [Gongronella butleri]